MTQALLDESDVIFLQGSLYEKIPHIAQKLAIQDGSKKELWLALPTQAYFKDNAADDIKRFPLASASVVLNSDKELQRLMNKTATGDALAALHGQFKQNIQNHKQIGFITASRAHISF